MHIYTIYIYTQEELQDLIRKQLQFDIHICIYIKRILIYVYTLIYTFARICM